MLQFKILYLESAALKLPFSVNKTKKTNSFVEASLGVGFIQKLSFILFFMSLAQWGPAFHMKASTTLYSL